MRIHISPTTLLKSGAALTFSTLDSATSKMLEPIGLVRNTQSGEERIEPPNYTRLYHSGIKVVGYTG